MLEDFKKTNQDPFCPSFSKNTIIEDSRGNYKNENCNILEGAHKSILDELIDDAVLELCFEIHRAAKFGLPLIDGFTQENWRKDMGTNTQTTLSVTCPECKQSKGATKYAVHLAACMGSVRHRSSFTKAAERLTKSEECDFSDSENYMLSPKKKGAKRSKIARKKPKVPGNSLAKQSSDSNPNYLSMSHDEKRAFFNKKCGVISKRTKKMCMNSHNCPTHTNEEREGVRLDHLRDPSDELPDNGQIDVDTVDEEIK